MTKRSSTYRLLSCLLLSVTLVACHRQPTPPAEFGYIDASKMPMGMGTNMSDMRVASLKEVATGIGAQGALAWRSWHISQALKKQATYLDHVFNFNRLLIDNKVLPPVLVESNHSMRLDSDETIRLANKTYELIQPARFVTTPPTWRSYLLMDYPKPKIPARGFLPRNREESIAWNGFIKEGWKKGLIQANHIFASNVGRLKRDFLGMVLYRKLLAQHMVTAPFITHNELGITGDSQRLRIDDRILRITAPSALQPDSSQWQPVIRKVRHD